MSSMPASAITSALPSFWQVMPFAPAATCSFASSGLLWVLMCGRLATPAASQAAWIRAMLRSTRSMSMTAAGGPCLGAILAGGGVVLVPGLFCLFVGGVEPTGRANARPMINSAKPVNLRPLVMMGIAALHPSDLGYGLRLFDLFA